MVACTGVNKLGPVGVPCGFDPFDVCKPVVEEPCDEPDDGAEDEDGDEPPVDEPSGEAVGVPPLFPACCCVGEDPEEEVVPFGVLVSMKPLKSVIVGVGEVKSWPGGISRTSGEIRN